jgi:glycosyltransferase involved in cell wall biosynthesis
MSRFISVIIPVYNDPDGIFDTLGALAAQTYARDAYEIIVVDNGSQDHTRDVVRTFEAQHPGLIKLVVEDKQRGSYAARNKGITNSNAEILVFVDADMWMAEDWLSRVAATMESKKIDYLACSVEIRTESESLVGQYNTWFGFQVRRYLEQDHFAPTCCLVVRRTVFQKVGLFDARLISGGDRLFGNRVYAARIDQHFAEDITLYHPARETLRSLTKKNVRIGRGNCQLSRRYPNRCESMKLRVTSFLPVTPVAYFNSIKGRPEADRLPWSRHLLFYALSCYTKWVRTVGHIYEAVVASMART